MAADNTRETDDLYSTDFITWTKQQAAIIRSLDRQNLGAALDFENLADEIEGLGRAALADVSRLLVRLLTAIIELALLPDDDPIPVSEEAIRLQTQLALVSGQGVLGHLDLEMVWRLARRNAGGFVEEIGEEKKGQIPDECPLKLDDLVSEGFEMANAVEMIQAAMR